VISDFGAKADDTALVTVAIQRALDTAAAEGGGRVVIPGGTFRSGALFLRQGVEFHLEAGARLLGSNRIEDYPRAPTRIEGKRQEWRVALLNGAHLTGVRLTGSGVVDGNEIFSGPRFGSGGRRIRITRISRSNGRACFFSMSAAMCGSRDSRFATRVFGICICIAVATS
jgi:polygalacturonase